MQITKILFFLMLVFSTLAEANRLVPPEDPGQTLAYWKPYIVSPEIKPSVRHAHQIFENLLKTWDGTRIEPVLHVVSTDSGPWAASLLDGTVLLSESAIEACKKIAGDRFEHVLAFVLAHEIAHQRTDDLWHFKFFRLVGIQKENLQSKLLDGFELEQDKFLQIEKQEAQADQDGLTLMTMVGYDPYEVVAKNNFFVSWVENVWSKPCQLIDEVSDQATDLNISRACKKAGVRAARAKAHLEKIAIESSLYQLGIEAFVAGQYKKSRDYFKAYGRLYPGHVIHNSIGVTYLSEVMQLNQQIDKEEGSRSFNFVYPMVLDMNPVAIVKKRGKNQRSSEKRKQRNRYINSAIAVFEKAIKLAPEYKPSYQNLIISYLLENNAAMAQGFLLGKYKQKFGSDIEFELLFAMTRAKSQMSGSGDYFEKLVEKVLDKKNIVNDSLTYMVVKNTAVYLEYSGKNKEAKNIWKKMAMRAKSLTDPSLFRIALAELRSDPENFKKSRLKLKDINNRLSKVLNRKKINNKDVFFWYQGEKIYHQENTRGEQFLLSEAGKVLSMSMPMNSSFDLAGLKNNDSLVRPFIMLGIPDRRISLINGEYISYDDAGIAIHIKDNKLNSWFAYQGAAD